MDLIESVRREFYTNTDHGLEKFLSMRIRHGTLSGTMRGSLDEQRLITTKLDSGYRLNEFWMERVRGDIGAVHAESVGRVLATLSESYDRLVEERLRPLIRAKPDSDSAAPPILGGPLAPPLFYLLRREAQRVSDFDVFLNTIFAMLIKHLDAGLGQLRKRLADEFQQGAEHIFTAAAESLRGLPECQSLRELRAALGHARAGGSASMAKVLGWLTLGRTDGDKGSYTAKQVAEIGVASARRTLRGFEFGHTVSAGEGVFGASVVTEVADILFIAIDNTYRHSGLRNPSIKVSLVASKQLNLLELTIESESSDAVFDTTSRAVEEVARLLDSGAYHEKAISEGRSGLVKLHKLTSRYDSGYAEFGFEGRTKFVVRAGIRVVYLEAAGRSETAL